MDLLGKGLKRLGDLADLVSIDGVEVDEKVVIPFGSLARATVCLRRMQTARVLVRHNNTVRKIKRK